MKKKYPILNEKQKKHAIKCLKTLISKYGKNRLLADELGITEQNLANWCMGRDIPPKYIPRLTAISEGLFTAKDFNPVIFF
jgi:hypothetical protein